MGNPGITFENQRAEFRGSQPTQHTGRKTLLKGANLQVHPNVDLHPYCLLALGVHPARLSEPCGLRWEVLDIVSQNAANSVPSLLKVTLLFISLVFWNSSAHTAKGDSFLFLPSNINLHP